jgi:hypothetical protein
MSLHVLLNEDVAEGDRQGIPKWPLRVREVGRDTPAPKAPWVAMTRKEYAALLALHEPEQLAWLEAKAPPPMPEPVPQIVTLRQLLFALRDLGWISQDEAMRAAKNGDLPDSFSTLLASLVAARQLTAGQADDAALSWAAMYSAERSAMVWQLFLAAGIATAEQVDAVFRYADAVI